MNITNRTIISHGKGVETVTGNDPTTATERATYYLRLLAHPNTASADGGSTVFYKEIYEKTEAVQPRLSMRKMSVICA